MNFQSRLTPKRIDIKKPFVGLTWPVRLRSNEFLTEASEYRGDRNVGLSCTQLGAGYTAKDQRRILAEWATLFAADCAVRELAFVSRVPQDLFDSACANTDLKRLMVKWGPVKDLSAISGLTDLEGLSLGTTGVEDLTPLATLPRLTYLQLDNLKKVLDFAALSACGSVEFLRIEGYPQGPQKIKMKDLQFLEGLRSLKALCIGFVNLAEFNLDFILALEDLEYLSLPQFGRIEQRRLNECAETICTCLPNLRYGNVVEHWRTQCQ